MQFFKVWLSSWQLTQVPSSVALTTASPAGTLAPCPAYGQLIPTVEKMGQISISGTSAMEDLVIAKHVSSSEQDNLVYASPGKSLCPLLTPV